jgi:hypothetical protein
LGAGDFTTGVGAVDPLVLIMGSFFGVELDAFELKEAGVFVGELLVGRRLGIAGIFSFDSARGESVFLPA